MTKLFNFKTKILTHFEKDQPSEIINHLIFILNLKDSKSFKFSTSLFNIKLGFSNIK